MRFRRCKYVSFLATIYEYVLLLSIFLMKNWTGLKHVLVIQKTVNEQFNKLLDENLKISHGFTTLGPPSVRLWSPCLLKHTNNIKKML